MAGPVWWAGALGGFVVAGFVTSWLPLVGVIVFFGGALLLMLAGPLRRRLGLQALAIALAENAFTLGHSLWLFTMPAGLSVRPMIWNLDVFVIGLGGLLLVCLLAIRSVWQEKRVILPGLAVLAALEGLLLGWQLLRLAARLRGFRIATD